MRLSLQRWPPCARSTHFRRGSRLLWMWKVSPTQIPAYAASTDDPSPRKGTPRFMLILGLNMFHADASAALVHDGEAVFAIAEERLNRIKHYGGFPALAVKACLDAVGAKITDIDHVAVGQDSDANLAKKVQYALSKPSKILNFIRLRQRKEGMRDFRSLLAGSLEVNPELLRFQEHHLEHHIAHIASAYYCSPL